MNNKNKNSKGFTLVELLLVIAIISLLSSIVLASVNNAKKSARDARRLSDIRQIRTALALFFDRYGYYPSSTTNASEAYPSCIGVNDTGWDDSDLQEFIPSLTGSNVRGDNPSQASFIKNIPGDPLGPDCQDQVCSQSYAYLLTGGSQSYTIVIHPEQNPLQGLPDCGQCAGNYDVCFYP